jgi:RND superfamily putative drug exporter
MELLGDANWWLPKWLDRRLPNVHIEGEPDLDHEIEELLEAEGPTPAEEHAAT